MTLPSPSSADILSGFPFKLSAPAMIYGDDILENVRILGDKVDNVEVVLFYTPALNNFPKTETAQTLYRLGKLNNLTYTVHLPASLEVASPDRQWREESVRIALNLVRITSEFKPVHYILHIPYTQPTLVFVPGMYVKSINRKKWHDWAGRASESLDRIQDAIGPDGKLLLENINYSPSYLEVFLMKDIREICLDVGHLLLGHENVIDAFKHYLPVTGEIHLHGVIGDEDHLNLGVLPKTRVKKWMEYLVLENYDGIVNLEVFTPGHLKSSLDLVSGVFPTGK